MTSPDRRLRVAIAQDEIAPDLASGLARTDQRAAEASRAGAALVVFPETWLPGYPAWLDVCRDAGLWDHPPVKAVYRRMTEQSVVVDGVSGHELAATGHPAIVLAGRSTRNRRSDLVSWTCCG